MANARRPKRTGRRRAEYVIMQATDSATVAEKEAESTVDTVSQTKDGKTQIIVNGDGESVAQVEEEFDAKKLKKEEYKIMEEKDMKDINTDLKLNTGDDEIVETIVKTAKTGMGIAGQFINDKAIVDSVTTR
jgi:hypothetical protein